MKLEQRQSGGGTSCMLAKEIIISRLLKLGTFLLSGSKILQRTSPQQHKFLRQNQEIPLGWRRMHRAALSYLGVSSQPNTCGGFGVD